MVAKPIERIDRHKDGSIKAKGYTVEDVLTGYWEWFRKAQKCGPDILKMAHRPVNGRPMTRREKSSKSRGGNPPVE
jgi:hypothetical protein